MQVERALKGKGKAARRKARESGALPPVEISPKKRPPVSEVRTFHAPCFANVSLPPRTRSCIRHTDTLRQAHPLPEKQGRLSHNGGFAHHTRNHSQASLAVLPSL